MPMLHVAIVILRSTKLIALLGLILALSGCGDQNVETTLELRQSLTHQHTAELVRVVHEGWTVPETSIVNIVRVRKAGDTKSGALVFSMETDGSDKERPQVIWVGDDLLKISIPRGVTVGCWVTQIAALRVDVEVK